MLKTLKPEERAALDPRGQISKPRIRAPREWISEYKRVVGSNPGARYSDVRLRMTPMPPLDVNPMG